MDCTNPTVKAYGGQAANACLERAGDLPLTGLDIKFLLAAGAWLLVMGLILRKVGVRDNER
jgi:hypothetical protein